MSYRQEMDNLTRHLGAVLAHREPLSGMDLEAAVAGFMATTHHLREVEATLVGTGPRGPRDLAALERAPIPLLGRLLRDMPALPQAAMTDVQTAPASTRAGAHWRVVARSATLAQHHWTTSLRSSRPTGPAAMAEIAQVARIAEQLAVTGPDLARDLRAAGRADHAARLLGATTSGLRIAAVAARQAAMVDAARRPVDLVAPPPPLVLVVRRPSHLPEALHRLAGLIDAAGHLTPKDTQLIARVCAETAHAAAHTARRHGHQGTASALDRQAELLAAAATNGRTASITPGDPRPLAQAQQIHLKILDLRRGTTFDLRDAWRTGEALPTVIHALDTTAHREIRHSTWLVPSPNAGPADPTWIPARPNTSDVPLAARLGNASSHAAEVTLSLAVRPTPNSAPARTASATAAPAPGLAPMRSSVSSVPRRSR